MSLKISKINIYENNWQTTVHDPRTKNAVADVSSGGYRRGEAAYSQPYVFSALRNDILSHLGSGEHRVSVQTVRQKLLSPGNSEPRFLASFAKRVHIS